MTILGVQFDKMRVTPAYDGLSLESIFGTDVTKVWGGVETFSYYTRSTCSYNL